MSLEPQLLASAPGENAAVRANAGSGKTWTLVARVARLLLHGARPEAILCVTYTKAAAAEMQSRLFERIGEWAVLPDDALRARLLEMDERPDDLAKARKLFAKALETPGGLKIQTIHAFCEKLLRRFPVEAKVSPGFTVLEDAAAARASQKARDALAHAALADGSGGLGAAYAHMSVQADDRAFQAMLGRFEALRHRLDAYFKRLGAFAAMETDIWRTCGLPDGPCTDDEIEGEALAGLDPAVWRRALELLREGSATDQGFATKIAELLAGLTTGDVDFAATLRIVTTGKGEAATWIDRAAVMKRNPQVQADLLDEQAKLMSAGALLVAAAMARDSVAMLTLAAAYVGLYAEEKRKLRGLDFDDLIAASRTLLTHAEGAAAWVLFKLDGGIDHVLVDEAQDTAPAQWDILRALTDEFFVGAGARDLARTVFFVGDEKQSIYSFQGAAPERLLQESQRFAAKAHEVDADFPQIDLLKSYRSRPEVLAFVDALAAQPGVAAALRPGDPSDDEGIVHEAARAPGGCVDLWPLEAGDPRVDVDPWDPVDATSRESGAKKLARRIAAEIKALIDRGDAVEERVEGGTRVRPATAGDVLILVRRRNGLFDEIIRALKQAGVPVAGADRLKLSGHVAFQDLLALGRFCRFPNDDLALAALLRSPLCDVDEDGLFSLAYKRSGSLWRALRDRAAEAPAFSAAVDLLTWALGASARLTPFDFYGALLSRVDGEGLSVRGRLLRRLGAEAQDVIDEFVAQALALERQGVLDLEGFVAAVSESDLEIKREQEAGGGQVRVMTVHGAKGLEAPIVFLPDTIAAARDRGEPVAALPDGGFLWAPRAGDDCPASATARALRESDARAEGLRLLYVALTRAKDRLVLCGVKREDRKAGFETGSWYELLDQTFAGLAEPARSITRPDGFTLRRIGSDPPSAPKSEAQAEAVTAAQPAWLRQIAPAEPGARRFASPSALIDVEPGSTPSPLAQLGGLGRFRRGEIIHRLLQILPDVPLDERRGAGMRMLAAERDLTDDQRAEMQAATFGVLEDPQFAAVFGPGSRPEVAIAGAAATLPTGLSGRIDRLVITDEAVLVVDFKTNRPAPARVEDADRAYILQMAAYRTLLAEVFPGRRIEAALVWTDGPKLMPVPENLMEAHLAALSAPR